MSILDAPLSEIREPNELAHFGVKGMKWGQRKLQKQGVTYRKAEPQPWEKGYIGNPTIKKHLKKHRLI